MGVYSYCDLMGIFGCCGETCGGMGVIGCCDGRYIIRCLSGRDWNRTICDRGWQKNIFAENVSVKWPYARIFEPYNDVTWNGSLCPSFPDKFCNLVYCNGLTSVAHHPGIGV